MSLLASGVLTRRYIQTFGCPGSYRYYSSSPYDSSKCTCYFHRGNEAPTAKQLHHTSCLSSWDGFAYRASSSTGRFIARLKATLRIWAILFPRKGIDCANYDGDVCFAQSSGRDQHRPLYSYQIPLEIPGYCHRNKNNN